MNFPSIDIQGSIISSDLLGKIRSEQANYQQGKDFNKDFTNAKLKDEISSAWQDAKGQWVIFQNKLSRLNEGETGTTETRNFWIVPLLANLGYNLSFSRQTEELNGKTFPIGYRDSQIDGFPVYIAGFHESLDRRPDNKQLRVSPHAMMQEYLNSCEYLYGIVTNGKQLRLLRDATRITRLSHLEFNLQRMMEEDLYSDFVLLYRLLHISRMPQKMDSGDESIIEKYHQEGLAAGSTIRNKLGDAVKDTIKSLANGFINHPDNIQIRTVLQQNKLDTGEYYHHMLRIIYRLLFLFVIDERNLVYADSKTPETKRFSQIYFNFYSLLRLRKLAHKFPPADSNRHYDLWQSLLSTFLLFEKKEMGEKLGIMSLQGDLFTYNAISGPAYDLHQCRLSNADLLGIIKALGYFENENKVLIAVNYGGLDVEEFGSVYEGLLELKLLIEPIPGTEKFSCSFDKSSERSKSGSHYTPEELVQPLIKHSLDYLIADKLRESNPESALLSLKVCDVACGSGHILLSAARRIAHELACLKETSDSGSKEKVEQPSPAYMRTAIKEVIRHCIYGVDKNPLAVELCKIALWLESHNPGEPLNFLDHHIKCGDAIVGLAHKSELDNGIANEAYKTLPEDDKNIAALLLKKNRAERVQRETSGMVLSTGFNEELQTMVQEGLAEYNTFIHLPERTPEEIERKQRAYRKFIEHKGPSFLKLLANIQIAQFFLPKTNENKDLFVTDGEFRQMYKGYKLPKGDIIGKVTAITQEKRFFHWFVEFPEVFENEDENKQGFDCVLGNPPFLGGQKLTGTFGDYYLECIKYEFIPIGAVDLVTYFFRRIFKIIRQGGFQSLISTNTIAQGRAREDGLDVIVNQRGTINHAVKSIKWPGIAAVEVSLVTITKQNWKYQFILNNKVVKIITPYLDDEETLGNPFLIKNNENKAFQGSIVLGKGYILEIEYAKKLIAADQKNEEVIFPYLNGDELNNNPDQSPGRWVINFFERTEEEAKEYFECYYRLFNTVKDIRQQDKRKDYRDFWWLHAEKRPGLYRAIKQFQKVLVQGIVTKTHGFAFVDSNIIYSSALSVFLFEKNLVFCLLQGSFHEVWAWKYSSTMKADRSYNIKDAFETFPFPNNLSEIQEIRLEDIGETYHEHRKQLMIKIQLGLTKTYNAFHSKDIKDGITYEALQGLDHKAIEKQFGKEVWNLWNHLQKIPNTCTIEEAIAGIIKLRVLHVEMDEAVLEAYGWQDVKLKHDFYEVDYLPENDRIRFTIHPDARKEILKRLLELNYKIHDEEVKAGLWDKKAKKENTYKTSKSKSTVVNEEDEGYGQMKLDLK